jgi:hypothetical protein
MKQESNKKRPSRCLARLVRGLVAREERRLNLPKHWAGTSSPSIAFMFRVGPWMIDRKGLHRECRAVSKDGKIVNRRWKQIYPTNANSPDAGATGK